MMPRTLALIALLATAASAAKSPPVVTPAGKPESCIPIVAIDHTVVRDDRTIDFLMRGGGKAYRNVLPNSCPGLGVEEAFAYETSLSQLCSVDIITVLNRGGGAPWRGASCGLGPFQPVTGLK